jgi:hypothetical protein
MRTLRERGRLLILMMHQNDGRHRLIDHLAEGKTPQEFLQVLKAD